ncbi:MAG: hypothetical protein ABH879_10205 [archaeon]
MNRSILRKKGCPGLTAKRPYLGFDLLVRAYDIIEARFSDILIMSGLTDVGIPAQAYRLATERGYETGGIACERAREYECYPTTEEPIIIGKYWGAVIPVFVQGVSAIAEVDPDKFQQYFGHPHYGLDAMIRIGGGPQSARETQRTKELGRPAYEFGLPRIR